eukprot:COSAG01_NODE_806_length_13438_cov_1217.428143_2_plen_45_part_00
MDCVLVASKMRQGFSRRLDMPQVVVQFEVCGKGVGIKTSIKVRE